MVCEYVCLAFCAAYIWGAVPPSLQAAPAPATHARAHPLPCMPVPACRRVPRHAGSEATSVRPHTNLTAPSAPIPMPWPCDWRTGWLGRRASGAAGTPRTTSGWCGTCTYRWAAAPGAPPTCGPSSRSWRCGTTSSGACWAGRGPWRPPSRQRWYAGWCCCAFRPEWSCEWSITDHMLQSAYYAATVQACVCRLQRIGGDS